MTLAEILAALALVPAPMRELALAILEHVAANPANASRIVEELARQKALDVALGKALG